MLYVLGYTFCQPKLKFTLHALNNVWITELTELSLDNPLTNGGSPLKKKPHPHKMLVSEQQTKSQ